MTKSPPLGGLLNRIPPSIDKTTKRCNGNGNGNSSTSNGSNENKIERDRTGILDSTKKHDSKRQKMDWDIEQFAKLNPNDNDVHAQRIASRYKMILKGKNTVGYDHYTQQVPKQSRRIRSMDTPNTPDHTLDIPAKRWQGLVKAWYVIYRIDLFHQFTINRINPHQTVTYTHFYFGYSFNISTF
jgi:hypothetical protein